jgi:hypothetical protein
VHLLHPRPTHPTTDCFFPDFFVHFRVFLDKGSSKTPFKHFCKKIPVENFYNTIDKNQTWSFSSYRVSRRFLVRGVQKEHVEFKTNRQKSNADVLSRFCFSQFWVFLGKGIPKTQQNIFQEKIFEPVTFGLLTSDPSTPTGVSEHVFGAAP